jgi:hypothetical protein
MYRRDRNNKDHSRGGEVLLYIKNTLNSCVDETLTNSMFEESVWCTINLSYTKLLVGNCYRSTASNEENTRRLLELLEDAVSRNGAAKLLIMGDFNFPEIDYENFAVNSGDDSDAHKFFDKTQDLFLYQNIYDSTRIREGNAPSMLDLIFTDSENVVNEVDYKPPVGKSDHVSIAFSYVIEAKEDVTTSKKFNYWKGDYKRINDELRCMNWKEALQPLNAEEAWQTFKGRLINLCEKHIPRKTVKHPKKNGRWISNLTLRKIKDRDKAWKRYSNYRSSLNYGKYKSLRNIVTSMIRQDKARYQHGLISSFKNNPKKFYGYVRSMQDVKSGVCRLRKESGELTDNDGETAEVLGKYFQQVFIQEDVKQDELTGVASDDMVITFEVDKVYNKLIKLAPGKSPGPDGVHPMVLVNCAEVLALPISIIFTKSYNEGVVLADWKEANVSPIFKKGNRNDPGNYRPVSLTLVVSKIMGVYRKGRNVGQVGCREHDDKIPARLSSRKILPD